MVNPHDTPNICLFKINFTQFGFVHEENKKQTLFVSLRLHLSRKRLNNLLSGCSDRFVKRHEIFVYTNRACKLNESSSSSRKPLIGDLLNKHHSDFRELISGFYSSKTRENVGREFIETK